MTERCSRPINLPDRELTQSEVEKYWLRDRGALITCEERHLALVNFYSNLYKKLAGA